jgi:hypothetical protein
MTGLLGGAFYKLGEVVNVFFWPAVRTSSSNSKPKINHILKKQF